MKKNYIARRFQRSLLITCLLASSSSSWAQSSQQKTGVGSRLPNKGVTMAPAKPLDASTTATNSTCPTCGTVLNSVTCSGGRSWNGNYCYCPSGTWDGFSCVLPPPPPPPAALHCGYSYGTPGVPGYSGTSGGACSSASDCPATMQVTHPWLGTQTYTFTGCN